MISIESWRSVVGGWEHRAPLKQRKITSFVHTMWESLHVRNHTRPPELGKSMVWMKRTYWGTLLLLLMKMWLLNSSWSHLTASYSGGDISTGEELMVTVIPAKLVVLLLLIAGIERNPGPAVLQAVCEYCGLGFKRAWNLKRHVERWHHNISNIVCRFCKMGFNNLEDMNTHMDAAHKPRSSRWQVTNSAFKEKVIELTYLYNEKKLEKALSDTVQESVLNQIRFYRRKHGSLKFSLSFTALMKKDIEEDEVYDSFYFQGHTVRVQSGEWGLEEKVIQAFRALRDRVLDLDVETEGSGWSFVEAEALTIQIVKMGTKKMGSYIPFKPRNMRGNPLKSPVSHTINVKNRHDQKCVIYCIILAKFGHLVKTAKDDPKNLKKYMKFVNDKDVEYPISEKDIVQLEENNKSTLNISLNIWKFVSNKHIEPYFISRVRRRGKTAVNMLMIERVESDGSTTQHLIYIKDVASLFRETVPGGQKRRHGLICSVCQDFATSSIEKLNRHFKQCSNPNYFKKTYPKAVAEFLPDGHLIPPPNSYRSEAPWLRGFFDFECLHQKKGDIGCPKCVKTLAKIGAGQRYRVKCPHSPARKTTTITNLPAICFSFLMIDAEDNIVYEKYYEGEDAASAFVELLMRKEPDFLEMIEKNIEMNMTEEDKQCFENATRCSECSDSFGPLKKKVRDHNHHTGEFRAALCNFCNLQKKTLLFIPLYCHNLSGFDSHLIIKAMELAKSDFSILPKNEEQIITMRLSRFKLIDSFSFMNQSLDTLASNLRDKGEKFFVQTQKLAKHSRTKFDVLTSKGIYPYEYMTDMERLKEAELPGKDEFYSSLKETDISDEDHKKACEVWKIFGCKTMSDYTRLYCRSDTYLLADVWKNFCRETSSHLKVHPEAGYFTLPAFSSDSHRLRMSNEGSAPMTLIDESMPELYDVTLKGIRGGSCMILHKAAFDEKMEETLMSYANEEEKERLKSIKRKKRREADRKSDELKKKVSLGKSMKRCGQSGCQRHISKKGRRCLVHARRTLMALDFNNLYGHSMTFRMPLDSFAVIEEQELLVHQKKFEQITLHQSTKGHYGEDSDTGYIFSADLEFTHAAQQKLLAFPLAPEGMVVEEEMLSDGQRQTWDSLFKKPYYTTSHKKMVSSFSKKKSYTSHYQYLKFLAALGVKVTLRKGYKFRQTNFISSYVMFCAQQRKKSTNAADKKLWKDLANIIYGEMNYHSLSL